MPRKYQRKTNWTPQEERQFTVTDNRPDHIDRQGVVDLLLFMAFHQPIALEQQTGGSPAKIVVDQS